MSLISTFELLSKRIGPPGGIGGVPNFVNASFRRLLQGYYLTIANPTNSTVNLRVQFVIPELDTGSSPFTVQQREFVTGSTAISNHVYAYDRTGGLVNEREVLASLSAFNSANGKVFSTDWYFNNDSS